MTAFTRRGRKGPFRGKFNTFTPNLKLIQMFAASRSNSMKFSKHLTLLFGIKTLHILALWSEWGLFKEYLPIITHKYAMAVHVDVGETMPYNVYNFLIFLLRSFWLHF